MGHTSRELPAMARREFLRGCLVAAGAAGSTLDWDRAAILPNQAAPPKKKWYQRSYRRHLFDFHVDDWNPEFLSRWDPKVMAENMALEKCTAVTVFANTHTGLCNYPTNVGQMHRGLKGRDALGEMINIFHKQGLDVVVYYVTIYTNWYWETHPDARTVDADGKSEKQTIGSIGRPRRFGTLCPNNEAYRDFVVAQLTEICTNYEFEGTWPDMTFWPTVCYCPSCKRRYAKEIGGEIPRVIDWEDPVWVRFQRQRQEWLIEFAHLITSTIKKLKPEATVAHQSGLFGGGSWRSAPSVALAKEMDWLSADTYGDRGSQAFLDKLFYSLSEIRPFEHINCWYYPNIFEHIVPRTEADLRCRAFDAFMNDGAMVFIDAIDPAGTYNRDNYITAGKVFGEIEKYEPYGGGKFCQDIAIYMSYDSIVEPDLGLRQNVDEPEPKESRPNADSSQHTRGAQAMARVLLEKHLPFGVITRKNLPQLSDYQMVLVPNMVMVNEEEVAAFKKYVSEGGSLYASKYTSLVTTDGKRQKDFLLADLFGVSYQGVTKEIMTYVDPQDQRKDLFLPFKKGYPVSLRDTQALVRLNGKAEVIATVTLPYTDPLGSLYASLLTDAPGLLTQFPSVVLNTYGKGKVMYSAGAMEIWDHETTRGVLANLLKLLATRPFWFETDAPKPVEITLFEQEDKKRFIIHVLNRQLEMPNIPIEGIKVKVCTNKKTPADLVLLPEGKKLSYALKGGCVEFTLPRLETYLMLALNYQ
jgi:hypothetical protein